MAVDRTYFRSVTLFPAVKRVLEYIADYLDESPHIPDVTASAAELNQLDGAILDTLAVEAGVGITAGVETIYASSVVKVGGIYKTSILIDLTDLSSATSDLDIIGIAGGPAILGQITAARNGTILTGRVTCLETPSSLTDIDLYSAEEGTGEFETGIGTLTSAALLTKGGAWSAGQATVLTAMPAADTFLYFVNGAADTPDVFTAGKFLIELEGYDA